MPIAFTPGEPSGIGPDIAIIYAQKAKKENLLVYCDPDVLIDRAKKLNLPIIGETKQQVINVLKDLRLHQVEMLTLGQYLQPSKHHLAVEEYITPEQFQKYKEIADDLGFSQVASGPMVRSSYHADLQAQGKLIN